LTESSDPRPVWDAILPNEREDITARLSLSFDAEALEWKNNFAYIPHELVRQALIDATDNQFNWSIDQILFRDDGAPRRSVNRETGEIPNPTVMIVVGTLTIPGLGSRAGIGAHPIDAGSGEDAAYKSADSDALKRAAMAFGVGLKQLYIDKPRQGGQQQQRQSTPPQNRSAAPQKRSESSAPERMTAFDIYPSDPPQNRSIPADPYGEAMPEPVQHNTPVAQTMTAPTGEFIPPAKDAQGRNVWTLPSRVTGQGKASDRQMQWIFDLLHKMQKNPYAYDWSDLPMTEATEWIDSLKAGKVPFED